MHAVPIDLDGNHKLTHTGRTAIVSARASYRTKPSFVLDRRTKLYPGKNTQRQTQTNTDGRTQRRTLCNITEKHTVINMLIGFMDQPRFYYIRGKKCIEVKI